jgi:hypothetical protein
MRQQVGFIVDENWMLVLALVEAHDGAGNLAHQGAAEVRWFQVQFQGESAQLPVRGLPGDAPPSLISTSASPPGAAPPKRESPLHRRRGWSSPILKIAFLCQNGCCAEPVRAALP